MATATDVDEGLDRVRETIVGARKKLIRGQGLIAQATSTLVGLPTSESALLAAINAYTPSNDRESLAKARLADYTSEFVALRTKAQTADGDVSGIDFTT